MIPYSELRQQPRRPASELLHLPAPLGIFIEPTNVCNFRCTMCPQSLPNFRSESGYFQTMDAKTFSLVIEQLRPWEQVPVIRLYGTGEPLLHPDIGSMIEELWPMARRIELTTNGTLLGHKPTALLRSGLDYLRISVYGLSPEECRMAGAKDFVNLPVALQEFREFRGAARRPWIHVQFTGACSNPAKFRQMFEPVADSIGMETLHNWGDLVKLGEAPARKRKVCPKPFYELFIHANGDVSACCLDWSGKLTLGNIHRETLQDIWNGEALARLRRLHLEGRRSEIPICASCSMPDTLPDNLDSVSLQRSVLERGR